MEDDEVKEPTQALSPVLDSTKGRKFIKNFKHKKRKSQLRLEDEFAQDIAFNLETLEQDSAWSGINLRNAEIGKPEVNFETASGKKHTVNKMSSELANELFSDFFGPNIDSKRENKFNFLTKTKLSHTSEKMTNLQSDRNFTGFRQDECMESKKKSRKLQQFIRNINKSLVIKYHEKFEANYDFSQDRKRRKLNDYKKVLEEPIESVDLYKSFDNKAQKSKNVSDKYVNGMEEELDKAGIENIPKFSTASGKHISISGGTFSKVNTIFKDIENIDFSSAKVTTNFVIVKDKITDDQKCLPQFSTALGKKITIPTESLSKVQNMFEDMPVSDILKDNSNFNDSNIENEICSKIYLTSDLLFRKENPQNLSEVTNIPQFSTASGKKIKIPPKSLLTVHQIFKDIPNMDNLKAGEVHDNYSKNSEFPPKDSNNSKCDERVKKENTTPLRKIPLKKLGSTSRKNGKISETALNRAKSLFGDMNFDDLPKSVVNISGVGSPKFTSSTPIRPRKIETQHISSNFLSTPIKKSFAEKIDCLTDFHQEYTCPFLIQKPTGGDLASWIEELDRQKLVLKKKLALISEKQEVIKVQMNASSNINEVRSQPFIKKINKSNLRDVCNLALNSESISSVNNVILQINPQNAALIHFNGNWSDVAVVTIEGCTLVPNQQGFIGVSEVEPAFLSMPDIKSSLIPKGWIKNHYKWIVWKLASYERFFPSVLGGCFTIDSVIKQLKYRYCREIFHAQRPALRKIYELDDIPQKRMILCISNIFKNGNNIELELTDGWYSIRTIIDEPLCHQVNIKKIQIGFKLVISGAELIGCEGCHPLETQEAQKVRLKINFNATRRAAWFTRMGYQKNPMPFLIQLRGANDMGGMIGGVKMYVVRSYPLIFREKSEESTSDVWRNRNAEFRMVQEFENKCFNNYEEMSIGDKIGNVNSIRKRNVTAVFQMKVIDVLGDSSKLYKCTFWDATDFHVQQLEENQVILVYSLSLRSNYELSCNKRTRFEILKEDTSRYSKYKRKYVPISTYDEILMNSMCGEFDTVGIIIKIQIDEEKQHVWLTDLRKRLLLIRIDHGPRICSLLNRINEGEKVAVCNLVLRKNYEEYSLAMANFHSVITQNPQYVFLREELEKLESVDRTELDILMNESRIKVGNLEERTTANSTSDGENITNFSKVTSTDIVMSMINIDEVVNEMK